MSQKLNKILFDKGFTNETATLEIENLKTRRYDNRRIFETEEFAAAKLEELLDWFLPPDAHVQSGFAGRPLEFTIYCERSWEAKATLYIRANEKWETCESTNDGEKINVFWNELKFEVNWSSNSSDLASAQNALDLAQELVTAGRKIEQFFEYPIYHNHEVREVK
jgi:hypothetical protein